MDRVDILGVKIDEINLKDATKIAFDLLIKPGKHIITTPNVEFIIKAQSDPKFKKILNDSDLAIPDSARFKWAIRVLKESNFVKRISLIPLIFTTKIPGASSFPVTPGVDLMEEICRLSAEKGFTVGLFGGSVGVAEKTSECLKKKFPKLIVTFSIGGVRVNDDGICENPEFPKSDFIFVALGQGKQEKWIENYKNEIAGKVFMGVGGAFDYLSGNIPRAPKWMRNAGMEWLYRGIRQPWRIKRFGALINFIFLILGY